MLKDCGLVGDASLNQNVILRTGYMEGQIKVLQGGEMER